MSSDLIVFISCMLTPYDYFLDFGHLPGASSVPDYFL